MFVLSHFARRDLDPTIPADSIAYDEICLAVVSNDDYDAILDEVKLASLKDIKEADRSNMIKAICKEITGIIDAGTFELCRLPMGCRAIPPKAFINDLVRTTTGRSLRWLTSRTFA